MISQIKACKKYKTIPLCRLGLIIVFIVVVSNYIKASRGAGAQAFACKGDRLWVRFPFEEIIYLIFLFLHSGVSIRNAPRIRREAGLRTLFTLGSLCLSRCMRASCVKLKSHINIVILCSPYLHCVVREIRER